VNEIRLPLGLSVAGHAICLVLLILLLPTSIPPVPEPLATGGMEVVLAQLPKQEEPPPRAETPPPPVETPPPEPTLTLTPEEPVATIEPPPPAPEVPAPVIEPPPPPAPRKPIVKPPPKPVVRRPEQTQPTAAPTPAQPTPAAIAAPQTAYAPTPVPAPVPSNEVSPGYRALLSAWLESHKRYPDSARQRGEQGHAILRFAVDRTGRVLNFALAQSSGFPDIDASIEEMMRNATLPPFPATMTQPRIDVSVTVRFSLTR
jgi:protein TonB